MNNPMKTSSTVADDRHTAKKEGVGVAVGAVGGGVVGGAAAGALAGGMTGPVGAAVGAVIGAVAGAIGARAIDPKVEDDYWRSNYTTRPYVTSGASYDDYQPAYRYGVDSYARNAGRSFDEVEPDLSRDWGTTRGTSSLDWERAKHATRDAWERVSNATERAIPGDSDRDGR